MERYKTDTNGLYQVSNLGRVKSLCRTVEHKGNYRGYTEVPERILKPNKENTGYFCITLYKNKKKKNFKIHRLVAEAFLHNPDNLPQINHKNENKSDNSVSNIEWCDASYNTRYSNARPVLQFDLNGKFIKEWKAVRDIVKELGCNMECITGSCKGKYKQSYGYIWRYKNVNKNYKLCYVDGNKAYFTNDFKHCWGDDWNDIPYECNAGEPYRSWSELIKDNENILEKRYIHHPIEIKIIYFETNDFSEKRPCDVDRFSVEMINNRNIPWIETDEYKIFGGTDYETFKKTILENNGEIYEQASHDKGYKAV